jgi:hypothetical protein
MWNRFWTSTFRQQFCFVLIWLIAMPLSILADVLSDLAMFITKALVKASGHAD